MKNEVNSQALKWHHTWTARINQTKKITLGQQGLIRKKNLFYILFERLMTQPCTSCYQTVHQQMQAIIQLFGLLLNLCISLAGPLEVAAALSRWRCSQVSCWPMADWMGAACHALCYSARRLETSLRWLANSKRKEALNSSPHNFCTCKVSVYHTQKMSQWAKKKWLRPIC